MVSVGKAPAALLPEGGFGPLRLDLEGWLGTCQEQRELSISGRLAAAQRPGDLRKRGALEGVRAARSPASEPGRER